MNHVIEDHLHQIRNAALLAVSPDSAVKRWMHLEGESLVVGSQVWELDHFERILLVGLGKAAVRMTQAAVDILNQRLTAGLVVTKYGHSTGVDLPPNIRVFESGHPIPDEAGFAAAREIEKFLDSTTVRDLVLVLISGGTSALVPYPVAGVCLSDLQDLTAQLLRCGADIGELNTIRKHVDCLKGGQLARLAEPARIISLVLSDVVGDPLEVIASGMTVPDSSTYKDALAILEKYHLKDQVPVAVLRHFEAGMGAKLNETPKPGDPLFAKVHNQLVGSNRLAAQAAIQKAGQLGYHTLLLTTFMEGEAREMGKLAVGLARGILRHGDPIAKPACLVLGGETTVTIRGQGKGGRNQELALAAALELAGSSGIVIMALATDGNDGPTDAAGAIVDGETYKNMQSAGLNPRALLRDNDSYTALAAAKALIFSGPTGTNVNDLVVILVN